VTVIIDQ